MWTVRKLAFAALAAFAVSALLLQPAAAQGVTVNLTVDDRVVGDGDRVEVDSPEVFANVTVESQADLNFVESRFLRRTVTVGATGASYNTSFVLEPLPGSNEYTVVAEDVEGNSERVAVDVYDRPTTAVELRDAIDRLEDRRTTLEDEVEELRERREELNRTRRELRRELNETRSSASDGDANASEVDDGGGGSEGLPGFGFVATLVALTALAAYGRRG